MGGFGFSMRNSRLRATKIFLTFAVATVFSLAVIGRAHPYDMPKNLEQGWQGDVQLGAYATFGPTDSSAVSANTIVSYSDKRWEHELDAKLYRSTSEAFVVRRDVAGVALRDANDKEITDLVSSTTNDRRYVSAQSRWFLTSRHYVFGIADLDVNTPVGLESLSRQIGGVGFKLYRSKSDYVSASLGVGRKQRDDVSGDSERGFIGYVGLRAKHKIGQRTNIGFTVNSDFGSESRYSEGIVSLGVKVRGPLSIKLKYEVQFDSAVFDALDGFDEGFEAAFSVNLAIEVF